MLWLFLIFWNSLTFFEEEKNFIDRPTLLFLIGSGKGQQKFELNHIYIPYIRPIIEYASVVWDGCSEQDSILLERLQNEAARIVTELARSVSLDNI